LQYQASKISFFRRIAERQQTAQEEVSETNPDVEWRIVNNNYLKSMTDKFVSISALARIRKYLIFVFNFGGELFT
jgi:hypothetical protein